MRKLTISERIALIKGFQIALILFSTVLVFVSIGKTQFGSDAVLHQYIPVMIFAVSLSVLAYILQIKKERLYAKK